MHSLFQRQVKVFDGFWKILILIEKGKYKQPDCYLYFKIDQCLRYSLHCTTKRLNHKNALLLFNLHQLHGIFQFEFAGIVVAD